MEEIDDQWRSYQVLDTYFTVPHCYGLQTVIGRGQYGTVCRATFHGDGGDVVQKVAIKKIAVPCTGRVELPELRRVVREVALLKHFRHDNIVGLLDAFIAPTLTTERNTEDIYLVTELMDVDLAALLKLHKALSLEHCRYFGSQLLRALVHVNQSGIMHRDLKPSNIVVNAECDLKVIDFGLARVLDGDEMTEYVVTRYYRAPELLLESSNYTPAIDIWSVGCIILEMAAGCVLIPGNDIRDQVISILKTTGKPAPEKIEKISSERARDFVRSQPDSPPLDLEAFVAREREKRGVAQEDFGPILDLARKLLQFSAEDRLTAAEALEHECWQVDGDDEEMPEEEEEEEEEGGGGGGGGDSADGAAGGAGCSSLLQAPGPSPLLEINVERKTIPQLRDLLQSMVGEYPSEKKKLARLKERGEEVPRPRADADASGDGAADGDDSKRDGASEDASYVQLEYEVYNPP